MGSQSLSNIARLMKRIDFPCSKQDIINYAEDTNAPSEVIEALQRLPDQQYYSMSDLVQEMTSVR